MSYREPNKPLSKTEALHFLGNSIAYLLETYMPMTSFDYPDISHRKAHDILEDSEEAIRKELRDALNAARREQYHNESINAKNG